MGEKLKLNKSLQQMTDQMLPYCKQQGVSKLGIFESFARGTARLEGNAGHFPF